MAKQRGPIALSESDFVEEVLKHGELEGVSKANVRAVLKAIKAEIADCLVNGYKISLTGLVTFTPGVKPGRKKGTESRNPATGEVKKLKADEPPKFKAKAKVSASITKSFPSIKSKTGQELYEQLKPAAKKTAKAATTKKGGKK